jgi:uncharacterized membrane protein
MDQQNTNEKKSLLGNALSFAFNGIFENILAWLLMWINFFGFLVAGWICFGIVGYGLKLIDDSVASKEITPVNAVVWLASLTVLIFAMTYLFGLWLGFTRTLIQFYDTHIVKFRPVWSVSKVISLLFMGNLLTVLVALGCIAFIIPGIMVYLRSMFAIYFLIDKDLGALASLQASWELTRGKYNLMLGLAILTSLVWLIPIVGWLGSGLMMVYVYRRLEKESQLL